MTDTAAPSPSPAPRALREERRPAALAGWLTRMGRTEAFDIRIHDLSYGGCRIDTEAALARGDRVELNVIRRGKIAAVVRWRNGHGTGLAFLSEEDAKPQKPRKVARLPVQTHVVARCAGRRNQAVDLADLSRFGCRLTFVEPPREDEWIWVTLPGLTPLEARVRWVDSRDAGIEFARPIHDAVFDLLLQHWGVVLEENRQETPR